MDKLHQTRTEFLDPEVVLRWALESTDRGLFDADEFLDEDLPARHDRVRREAATLRSST